MFQDWIRCFCRSRGSCALRSTGRNLGLGKGRVGKGAPAWAVGRQRRWQARWGSGPGPCGARQRGQEGGGKGYALRWGKGWGIERLWFFCFGFFFPLYLVP